MDSEPILEGRGPVHFAKIMKAYPMTPRRLLITYMCLIYNGKPQKST